MPGHFQSTFVMLEMKPEVWGSHVDIYEAKKNRDMEQTLVTSVCCVVPD